MCPDSVASQDRTHKTEVMMKANQAIRSARHLAWNQFKSSGGARPDNPGAASRPKALSAEKPEQPSRPKKDP